jgi:hypothetical protein
LITPFRYFRHLRLIFHIAISTFDAMFITPRRHDTPLIFAIITEYFRHFH